MMGHKEILEKYKQILETFFDAIMEDVKQDQPVDFYANKGLSAKYDGANSNVKSLLVNGGTSASLMTVCEEMSGKTQLLLLHRE